MVCSGAPQTCKHMAKRRSIFVTAPFLVAPCFYFSFEYDRVPVWCVTTGWVALDLNSDIINNVRTTTTPTTTIWYMYKGYRVAHISTWCAGCLHVVDDATNSSSGILLAREAPSRDKCHGQGACRPLSKTFRQHQVLMQLPQQLKSLRTKPQ